MKRKRNKMTHAKLDELREEKAEILREPSNNRVPKLRELAQRVGAQIHSRSHGSGHTVATANEVELSESIDMALQTASLIIMCEQATKSCWVAVGAAIVAILSAAAAWTAVLTT